MEGCSKDKIRYIQFCMMSKSKIFTGKNFMIAAAVSFAAAMVAFPSVTETGTKSAILIWLNSIVPVLLPFFIFADFLKEVVDMERIPTKIYPLLMAILSGYPIGAKAAGDLVKSGMLDGPSGRHVVSYSLVTGPAFILGTTGIFLGSNKAAAVVAAAHYLGALCNGRMWRSNRKRQDDNYGKIYKTMIKLEKKSLMDIFTRSILNGFKSMAFILAWLIIFMISADLLEMAGILDYFPNSIWRSVAKGLLEMTMGINALCMCNINLPLKTMLTSFIISFGGLSVIGQAISISGEWLGAIDLIKIKITHGLFAGIIAFLIIISGNTIFQGDFLL